MPGLKRQSGVSLIESLVATTILAIGSLGLLTVQIRTLAETQTSVHRAQAVRAIEDLAERIKANPDRRRIPIIFVNRLPLPTDVSWV